jgi:hypothetical protein
MPEENGWREHKRDVLNRLAKVETRLEGQDDKLDIIIVTQAELKTDKKWAGKIIVGLSSLMAFLVTLAVNWLKG